MATAKAQTNGSATASEDVSAQIAALKSDIAGLTEALGNYASAKGNDAKQRASEQIDTLAQKGRDSAAIVSQETEKLAQTTGDLIRQQPAAAVGIAAALGFAVGLMTSRRG
ncbi:DUF883 family protein [Parasulfitobacter algicola]|uniref:DUF883 family protein n=1 Tax=Parasulfitobacter algicola TaxID=2614809 RepID=A0ABX2IVY0_9RHOB|nr:DUF883 family protein [Sulfitobacter algicola]NSX54343.1 DUF883 family protein [Sulfitobacter algicola]